MLSLHRHLAVEHVRAGSPRRWPPELVSADVVAVQARKHAGRDRTGAPTPAGVGSAAVLSLPPRPAPDSRPRRELPADVRPLPTVEVYDQHLHTAGADGGPGDRVMTRPGGMTEPAADAAITSACRLLRLPTVPERFTELADAAAREQMTFRGFLSELLLAECDDRDERNRARRVKDVASPGTSGSPTSTTPRTHR